MLCCVIAEIHYIPYPSHSLFKFFFVGNKKCCFAEVIGSLSIHKAACLYFSRTKCVNLLHCILCSKLFYTLKWVIPTLTVTHFLNFFDILFIFVYGCFSARTCLMCSTCWCQKRATDTLELEPPTVVS